MGTTFANGLRKRLTPGVAVASAAAAGTAGMLASGGALFAWPEAPALAVTALVLSPALIAAVSFLAARHAMRAALRPAIDMAKKLAVHDLSGTDAPARDAEVRELTDALARCRESLAVHDKALRVHAAAAKLTGAGVARLAQGDFSARIPIDLPAPYDAFRRDFNTAMERLQENADSLSALRTTTDDHVMALAEAAMRLERRAQKLDARIDADLHIVEVLCKRDAEEALAVARNTLAGAGIATRRNIQAAAELARLGEALRGQKPLANAADADEEEAEQPAAPAKTMAA